MKINVLFFATIRDIVGEKKIEVNLPPGSTVKDLKQRIVQQHPQAEQAMQTMLTSVDHVFSEEDKELHDQAEVAFFPHVSGG